MGTGTSKERQPLLGPKKGSAGTRTNQESWDCLLVFRFDPPAEDVVDGSGSYHAGSSSGPRVRYDDAVRMLGGCLTDAQARRELEEELYREWEKRYARPDAIDANGHTGPGGVGASGSASARTIAPGDGLKREAFLNLARALICSVLRQKCQVEVKPVVAQARRPNKGFSSGPDGARSSGRKGRSAVAPNDSSDAKRAGQKAPTNMRPEHLHEPYIFVLVRGRTSQLLVEAQRTRFPLRFCAEIDPGFEYWAKRGVSERAKVPLSREEAVQRLDLLFENNVIDHEQNRIFDGRDKKSHGSAGVLRGGVDDNAGNSDVDGADTGDDDDAMTLSAAAEGTNNEQAAAVSAALRSTGESESQALWSARVHALQRMADRPVVTNPYPHYAPFTGAAHVNYLFARRPTNRGFREFLSTKDRIALTQSMIARYIDCDRLQAFGLLHGCCALHGASDGETLSLLGEDGLRARWCQAFSRAAAAADLANDGGLSVTVSGAASAAVKATQRHRHHAHHAQSNSRTHNHHHGCLRYWPCRVIRRAFAQPLLDIERYYGSAVAFYFAFVAFYSAALVPAAFIGVGVFLLGGLVPALSSKSGGGSSGNAIRDVFGNASDELTVAFGAAVTVWAALFVKLWRREQMRAALYFGTAGPALADLYEGDKGSSGGGSTPPSCQDTLRMKERAQFHGTHTVQDKVTHLPRREFPRSLRQLHRLGGALCTLLVIVAVLVITHVEFELRSHILGAGGSGGAGGSALRRLAEAESAANAGTAKTRDSLMVYAFGLAQATRIEILAHLFRPINHALCTWENHRTEPAFESAKILNAGAFALANHCGALYYVIAVRGTGVLGEARSCRRGGAGASAGGCVHEVQVLLLCILLVRGLFNLFFELGVPCVTQWLRSRRVSSSTTATSGLSANLNDEMGHGADAGAGGVAATDDVRVLDHDPSFQSTSDTTGAVPSLPSHEREYFHLTEYSDTFDDFESLMVQFMLILSFGATLPLALPLVLLQNLLEIRVDALKLTRHTRRPWPQRVAGIGAWDGVLSMALGAGALSNVALAVFATALFHGATITSQLLVMVAAEHILLLFKGALDILINNMPEDAVARAARNRYVEYLHMHATNADLDADAGHPPNSDAGPASSHGKTRPKEQWRLQQLHLQLEPESNEILGRTSSARERLVMLSAREVTLAARLEAKDRELVALRAVEELNPESGIGMDKHGAPISKLSVRIVRATDLPEHKIKSDVFVEVSIMPDSAGPGAPKLTSVLPKGANIEWSQNVAIEPVHSKRGYVVFTVREMRKQKIIGKAETSLRSLEDQRMHERDLAIVLDGRFNTSVVPRLNVKLMFYFSQTVKVRKNRLALEAEHAHVLQQMQQLQQVTGATAQKTD